MKLKFSWNVSKHLLLHILHSFSHPRCMNPINPHKVSIYFLNHQKRHLTSGKKNLLLLLLLPSQRKPFSFATRTPFHWNKQGACFFFACDICKQPTRNFQQFSLADERGKNFLFFRVVFVSLLAIKKIIRTARAEKVNKYFLSFSHFLTNVFLRWVLSGFVIETSEFICDIRKSYLKPCQWFWKVSPWKLME